MTDRTEDYRVFLGDVLKRRQTVNKRYSLRAFARDLGVNPPRLSEVLRGKKGLSLAAAKRIAEKLGLDSFQTQHFCDLVEVSDARSPVARQFARGRVLTRMAQEPYQGLSQDTFRVIADWYHYAILELTLLDSFQGCPRWISKALGMTEQEARDATGRLMRLGLLRKTPEGAFEKTHHSITTTHNRKSEAIRFHNKQMLQKAQDAIEDVPLEERDISTIVMPINKQKWQEACERIRNFRREMCAFLEDGEVSEVYCMAVQLFPLSQVKELSNEK